jgi:squalene-hopene/tetraprenyl-beta-curcumene cyclase
VQGLHSVLETLDIEPDRATVPTGRLRAAIHYARRALLRLQRADGHWVGELQGDTILESEFVILLAFLGRENDDAVRRCANYILAHQQPDGGWSNYPGGPPDVSVSTKAYLALKIAGIDADDPRLRRAREVIRSLGGPVKCNSFSKFYLALVGQFPYRNCPSVPPELVLLPGWIPFNIYAMSSWTRTILVPLSIMAAHKPIRRLPDHRGIRELFLDPPDMPQWVAPPTEQRLSWTNFFLGVDWLWKNVERFSPFRRRAVRRAAAWMREHFEDSDGVGAIFPPMIYTVIALRCLGVPDDDPEFIWAMKQLEDLMIPEGDTLRLQPCVSPVWDTALSLIALADAGIAPQSEAVQWGVDWLLDREVRRPGDWSRALPDVEPAGWVFEYRNGFYPDNDDTAMVLMALARNSKSSFSRDAESSERSALGSADSASRLNEPINRAIRWLLAMQNSDGGWAAFDRDINWHVLEKVPFADHNAMLDPSCPDITARVLEALGHFGYRPGHPAVDRGIEFLRRTQCADGGWIGRWGVNYLYGTWQVLQGLRAIDFPMDDMMVRRAVAWLKRVQQPSGAWGESCASYDDPKLAGIGSPTASQTAWALLGLIAAGESNSPEVHAGIGWLLRTQNEDGGWTEEPFTGTGFPRVFYLKYHLYSLYFPLMALGRYSKSFSRDAKSSERSALGSADSASRLNVRGARCDFH